MGRQFRFETADAVILFLPFDLTLECLQLALGAALGARQRLPATRVAETAEIDCVPVVPTDREPEHQADQPF